MASLTVIKAVDTTERTHTGDTNWTATNDTAGEGKIAGSSLTASTTYVVAAFASYGNSSTTTPAEFRLHADDDSNVETRSLNVREFGDEDDEHHWGWVGEITTDSSPGDIRTEFRVQNTGHTVRADNVVIMAIEKADLTCHSEVRTTTSSEYDTTSTSLLAIDASADLAASSTYLVFACNLTDTPGTTYSHEVKLRCDNAGDDVALSDFAPHLMEGEDAAQQFCEAMAGVHKTSSSRTLDPAIWVRELNAAHDAVSLYSYIIAIDTGDFEDFDFVYTSGSEAFSTLETTDTISSYTPTTNGDHLVVGSGGFTSWSNAADVTVGGTSIITGAINVGQIDYADSSDIGGFVLTNVVDITGSNDIDLDVQTMNAQTDAITRRFLAVLSLELTAGPVTNDLVASVVATGATTGDAIQINDPTATIAGTVTVTDAMSQSHELGAVVAAVGETSDGVIQTNSLSIVPP
jgi:hypothetical protein